MNIFENVLEALQKENSVMLATIISTSGSTPASAFSKMLIMKGGTKSVGTVGGGCMEGDVLSAARRLYDSQKVEILTFHLNENEFVQGLICGGSLDVLVEPVTREQSSFLRNIMERRNEGEDSVVMTLIANTGRITKKELLVAGNQPASVPFGEDVARVLHRNEVKRLKTSEGDVILEPIAGTPNLLVFGGGHVSRSISKAATLAGFRVTIVDDRQEYANPERFPEAGFTLAADFPEAFDQLNINGSTYIAIVTRGHRYDEEILERAVQTPAKYIGMIGSKRKVLTTYEHLLQRGASIENLKRVQAPMGIEIGAVTAEEIGVSVVAQLIAARRAEHSPYVDKSDEARDLFIKLEKMIEHTRQKLR